MKSKESKFCPQRELNDINHTTLDYLTNITINGQKFQLWVCPVCDFQCLIPMGWSYEL